MPTRSELAKIHIAKQQLGLSDASYRNILKERYDLDSAAGLNPRQVNDLLELFRAKGWRPATPGQCRLVHHLWHRLNAAGVLEHSDGKALNAFITHFTAKNSLSLLTVHEARKLIEMLKKWLNREGARDRLH